MRSIFGFVSWVFVFVLGFIVGFCLREVVQAQVRVGGDELCFKERVPRSKLIEVSPGEFLWCVILPLPEPGRLTMSLASSANGVHSTSQDTVRLAVPSPVPGAERLSSRTTSTWIGSSGATTTGAGIIKKGTVSDEMRVVQ